MFKSNETYNHIPAGLHPADPQLWAGPHNWADPQRLGRLPMTGQTPNYWADPQCAGRFWYVLIRFDTCWYVLIRFDTFWYVFLIVSDTLWYVLIRIWTPLQRNDRVSKRVSEKLVFWYTRSRDCFWYATFLIRNWTPLLRNGRVSKMVSEKWFLIRFDTTLYTSAAKSKFSKMGIRRYQTFCWYIF